MLDVVSTPGGVRHRDFRTAVNKMSESSWADWPFSGPRTLLWLIIFIAEHYGSPEVRHGRFMADGHLTYQDVGAQEHQVIMKLLYLAVV